MGKLFFFSDTDDSGDISLQEFEESMESEEFEVFLKETELDKDASARLFELLDTDRSGTLSIEEFVQGCIRLRGPAKFSDVQTLKYDFDFADRNVKDQLDTLQTHHTRTHKLLGRIIDMIALSPT